MTMLIQNYGLHWKRENVFWGKPGTGNQGHLSGRLASSTKSITVDFRYQAGIYILQDGFKPVYIGQVGSGEQKIFARIKSHTKSHLAERWDRISWFGIYPVKGGEVNINSNIEKQKYDAASILNHIEGALISVTEPALNRKGANWGDAEQYVQVAVPKKEKSEYEIEIDEEDDI